MIAELDPRWLVDLVIGVLLLEFAALAALHRRTGLAARTVLASLAAGLCLLLALRSVLAGAPWVWMALALAAGGVAHGIDLWQRLRARGPPA